MKKQKGQDIIEYALMLAVVVGIGFGIYAHVGIGDHISTVFNNAGNLLEEVGKGKQTTFDSPDDAIKRLFDERYGGSSDILEKPATGEVKDIAFDSKEGQELARKLNIQTKEGDGWYVRIFSPGTTVVTYYSASDNSGVTFSQLKNAKPGDKEYLTKINIHEGIHDGSGKETYNTANNTANTGRPHDYDAGHVERNSKGQFVSIYPGDY